MYRGKEDTATLFVSLVGSLLSLKVNPVDFNLSGW